MKHWIKYYLAVVLVSCVLEAGSDVNSLRIIKRHPLADLGTDSCALCPDGRMLACDYTGSPAGSGGSLRLRDSDGRVTKDLHPVLRTKFSGASGPVWAPDGKKLAFHASNTDILQWGVWVIGINGQGLKPLLLRGKNPKSSHEDIFRPVSWSPDGKWILCTRRPPVFTDRYGGSPPLQLWKLSADGKRLMRLSEADYDYAVWSPDGKSIACWKGRPAQPELVGGGIVWIMDSNGRHVRQVLSSAAFEKLSAGERSRKYEVMRPFWYADNRHLIVSTDSYKVKQVRYGVTLRPAVTEERFDLWVVDITKGIPERLGEGQLQSGALQGKHFLIRIGGKQDKREIIEVSPIAERK